MSRPPPRLLFPLAPLALALLAAFACAPACRATSGAGAADSSKNPARNSAPTAPRVSLSPPGHDTVTVAVEVVSSAEDRQRGLMYRKHLDPDAGMLFLFEQPQQLTFWMHNTLVPLDMIFITSDWKVLGIVENATPLTDAARSVPGLSQYVLEVNAGFGRRHGFGPGTAVRYVPASP
jgi:uncharacterized membrane protein (UPF0127 family)